MKNIWGETNVRKKTQSRLLTLSTAHIRYNVLKLGNFMRFFFCPFSSPLVGWLPSFFKASQAAVVAPGISLSREREQPQRLVHT